MQIFVNADACPVVGIIETIAEKYNIPTTLLCDTNHILFRQILDIYRSAVSYLTEVYEQVWEELERKTNEKSNRICICTSWKYREISKKHSRRVSGRFD